MNMLYFYFGVESTKKRSINYNEKHLILKLTHPSLSSCYRGFSGCKHFSKANAYLKQFQGTEINWET